jgi:hypothetical protein
LIDSQRVEEVGGWVGDCGRRAASVSMGTRSGRHQVSRAREILGAADLNIKQAACKMIHCRLMTLISAAARLRIEGFLLSPRHINIWGCSKKEPRPDGAAALLRKMDVNRNSACV